MTIPTEIAQRLSDEAVAAALMVELNTSEGALRFLFGENGVFRDISGNDWIGSTLMRIGEVEQNNNGTAPTWEVSLTYVYDPAKTDPISVVREFGVAAIDGRRAKLYFQYFARIEEMYAPIYEPILISTHTMRRLVTKIDGPQTRSIAVICEGPYPLRSNPTNGRYTDADQRRRANGDPSLEFIPNHGFDDQPLFGI